MFTSIETFEKTWKTESENTAKVLDSLTDDSLSQAVADDHRTLGRIAWHIVTTIPDMMPQTGLKCKAVDPKSPVPDTAGEIAEKYRLAADELLQQIKTNWDDRVLTVEDDLYGEKWPRGLTLSILIRHEVHHRGQITVLMRQAGLPVPGCYGPSKEEWVNYGTQPPEV